MALVCNKNDLAIDLSHRLGCSVRNAQFILDCVLKSFTAALKDGKRVQINKFGVLEVRERKAKLGRNPKDPNAATYHVPARKVVKFKIGNELDSIINTL
jgi:DNA-binding protein HU-beta